MRPWIKNRKVQSIVVRNPNLRWPVALPDFLVGSKVLEVWRRGKYLVIDVGIGSLIAHLGMSGSLRIVDPGESVRNHDHLDIEFSRGIVLRYNDPRRFGSCTILRMTLWIIGCYVSWVWSLYLKNFAPTFCTVNLVLKRKVLRPL